MKDREPANSEALSVDDLEIFREETESLLDVDEDEGGYYDEGEASEEPEEAADDPREHRRARRAALRDARRQAGASKAFVVLGMVITLAGVTLAVLAAIAPASVEGILAGLGRGWLGPVHFILMGLVVAGFAGLQYYHQRTLQQVASSLELMQDAAVRSEDAEQILSYLVETQSQHEGGAPASQELGWMQKALQRQDEKINNLSRALKLYGQPLVDISKRVSDGEHHLEELHKQVKLVHESLDRTAESLARTLHDEFAKHDGDPAVKQEIEAVCAATKETARALARLESQIGEELREKLVGDVAKLLGEQQQDGTGEIEGFLQRIEQDLTELTGAVASIRVQAPADAGALESTPAPIAQPKQPAKQAARQSAKQKAREPAAQDAVSDAQAQYSAGEHKGSKQNVLGAIAKLKQMRQ